MSDWRISTVELHENATRVTLIREARTDDERLLDMIGDGVAVTRTHRTVSTVEPVAPSAL